MLRYIAQVEVHSMMALLGLLWRSPSPLLRTLCVLWIFINLVSIALPPPPSLSRCLIS